MKCTAVFDNFTELTFGIVELRPRCIEQVIAEAVNTAGNFGMEIRAVCMIVNLRGSAIQCAVAVVQRVLLIKQCRVFFGRLGALEKSDNDSSATSFRHCS